MDPQDQGLATNRLADALDEAVHEGGVPVLGRVGEALDSRHVDDFITLDGVSDRGIDENANLLRGLQLKSHCRASSRT